MGAGDEIEANNGGGALATRFSLVKIEMSNLAKLFSISRRGRGSRKTQNKRIDGLLSLSRYQK